MSDKIAIRDTNLAAALTQTAVDALQMVRVLTDSSLPRPEKDQLTMLEEALDHARFMVKEYRRKITPIELKGQRG